MDRIITNGPADPWSIVPSVRMEITMHPAVLRDGAGVNPMYLSYDKAAVYIQNILHRAISDESGQVSLIRAKILPATPEEELSPVVEELAPEQTPEDLEEKIKAIKEAGLNKRLEEKMIRELLDG